jgi:hypothetical protein
MGHNLRTFSGTLAAPSILGMKMSDVRPGMTLRSTMHGREIVTVAALSERGFHYSHPSRLLGPMRDCIWTESGEHFGVNGYALYWPADNDPTLVAESLAAEIAERAEMIEAMEEA